MNKPVTAEEREARRAVAPGRRKDITGYTQTKEWVKDEHGNASNERTVDSVAAKVSTLPQCLRFLSGVACEGVCAYHALYEASRPASTGGYTPKVDGGGSDGNVYDHDTLVEWGRIRKQVRGMGLRLIDRAFERDGIVYSLEQKELMEDTGHRLAQALGIKN